MSLSNREKNKHYSRLLSIGVVPLRKCRSLSERDVRLASKDLNIIFDTKDATCKRLQTLNNKENKVTNENELPPLVSTMNTRSKTKSFGEGIEEVLQQVAFVEPSLTKNKPYSTRRLDSLLTVVDGNNKYAIAEKNNFLRQRFHWPPARTLDKDVDLMCDEFFKDDSDIFPKGDSKSRLEFLYQLASVFFDKENLDAALNEEEEVKKRVTHVAMVSVKDSKENAMENAANAASTLIHDVIVSSHGEQALSGKKGKDLRRAARLCLLLSHPITIQTLKINGKVEHLDRENIESLRQIEKEVEKEYIQEQLYRNETWSDWLSRHTSKTLAKIYRFATFLTTKPYPTWHQQKKFLLRALRASTQIHKFAGKAANVIYGKPERPNFDFFNPHDFSGVRGK